MFAVLRGLLWCVRPSLRSCLTPGTGLAMLRGLLLILTQRELFTLF
jgi:hypothetical protein